MYLSLVIPAYNESLCIKQTVETAFRALADSGIEEYEVIVADDHSTDDTAALAQEAGARVVSSGKRNIGGTRNVGAAAAQGTHLLFVDADTLINPTLLQATRRAFESGAVAGGAGVQFDRSVPRWMEFFLHVWNWISRFKRLPAGSFFFARRDAFESVGGFDEKFYFTEELDLGRRLKKKGRVVILRETYVTSARKASQFSGRELRRLAWRMILSPRKVHNREHLAYWYERREE